MAQAPWPVHSAQSGSVLASADYPIIYMRSDGAAWSLTKQNDQLDGLCPARLSVTPIAWSQLGNQSPCEEWLSSLPPPQLVAGFGSIAFLHIV
ncbi:hypothetical protein AV530_012992 [Patagioenas fasciata monilis]|uniref:Uncharacterized protein n=1 Tax=Patagioenas fasciata monilis TaxID=372326 RepID=A0A1V4JA34_PATFA|nr:hypothetical protein AV530_012992 [Patagioenas fasciata monilis]